MLGRMGAGTLRFTEHPFHGGGCQETTLHSPVGGCLGVRRRPPRSTAVSDRVVGRSRWDRSPIVRGIGHPGRLDSRRPWRFASRSVLRPSTGTIFPSGPWWAMASFGPVEGHSLSVGARLRSRRPNGCSDARLRPCLDLGHRADRPGLRADRSVRCRGESFLLLDPARVVLLLVLPHPQDNGGHPAGDR
jgi:hypothetical protein